MITTGGKLMMFLDFFAPVLILRDKPFILSVKNNKLVETFAEIQIVLKTKMFSKIIIFEGET